MTEDVQDPQLNLRRLIATLEMQQRALDKAMQICREIERVLSK